VEKEKVLEVSHQERSDLQAEVGSRLEVALRKQVSEGLEVLFHCHHLRTF